MANTSNVLFLHPTLLFARHSMYFFCVFLNPFARNIHPAHISGLALIAFPSSLLCRWRARPSPPPPDHFCLLLSARCVFSLLQPPAHYLFGFSPRLHAHYNYRFSCYFLGPPASPAVSLSLSFLRCKVITISPVRLFDQDQVFTLSAFTPFAAY